MNTEPKRKGDMVALTDGTLTEAAARDMLEKIRWPDGLRCIFPDCGGSEVYKIVTEGKTYPAKDGKKERTVPARHLYKCKACRRQFTVTKGTIFEDSKIPLRTWIMVMYRMCSSKKGVSAHQIHREFGIAYESAWFMCHRIRYAMGEKEPMMLTGTVEADETYVGGKPRGNPVYRGQTMTRTQRYRDAWNRKAIVLGMVERGGNVRAKILPGVSKHIVQRELNNNIDMKNARLMSDESPYYTGIAAKLPHGVIRHKSEYVRGDVHTQSIESFWAILKRGLIGVYHHVDAAYLNQYIAEFQFRYNSRKLTDAERWARLGQNIEGRLDWYLGQQAKVPVES